MVIVKLYIYIILIFNNVHTPNEVLVLVFPDICLWGKCDYAMTYISVYIKSSNMFSHK